MIYPISNYEIDNKYFRVNWGLQEAIQDILSQEYYNDKLEHGWCSYNGIFIRQGIRLRQEDAVKICKKMKTNDKYFIKIYSKLCYPNDPGLSQFIKIFRNPNPTVKDIEALYKTYESSSKLKVQSDKKVLKETRQLFLQFIRLVSFNFYNRLDNFYTFGDDFEFVKKCEVCTFNSFRKAVGEYLNQNQEILLESAISDTKFVDIELYSEYFDNEFCIKLLEKNKVYPKSVLNNHTFTEEELINIITKAPAFKNKSYVLGGQQQQRQNACNHIIKTQTVSLNLLKKILEICFPDEEDLFLKALGNRSILIKDLPLDDELVMKMVDSGTNFKYVNTENLSTESQLLIEVSK